MYTSGDNWTHSSTQNLILWAPASSGSSFGLVHGFRQGGLRNVKNTRACGRLYRRNAKIRRKLFIRSAGGYYRFRAG